MRPLEHIFWHSTGEWLRACTRDSSDPLRRKLMLVVDEAHPYCGALGTEFSLLLNRLLNVLNVEHRLQFIITSASLGTMSKQTRCRGLLSLKGGEREQGSCPPTPRTCCCSTTGEGVHQRGGGGKLHDIKKRDRTHHWRPADPHGTRGPRRPLWRRQETPAEQNHLHIDDILPATSRCHDLLQALLSSRMHNCCCVRTTRRWKTGRP